MTWTWESWGPILAAGIIGYLSVSLILWVVKRWVWPWIKWGVLSAWYRWQHRNDPPSPLGPPPYHPRCRCEVVGVDLGDGPDSSAIVLGEHTEEGVFRVKDVIHPVPHVDLDSVDWDTHQALEEIYQERIKLARMCQDGSQVTFTTPEGDKAVEEIIERLEREDT